MNICVVVYLKDGRKVHSVSEAITEEELEQFKEDLQEIVTSSAWQINVNLVGDSWAIFPGENIQYVELQKRF